MFFIFGSPRSGTTLMAQSLSAHSDIVVPHETDFIIPSAFIFDRIKDEKIGRELLVHTITNGNAFGSSLGEFLSAAEVRSIIECSKYELASVLRGIYEAVATSAGCRLAGDKSPNDLLFLRILVKSCGLPEDAKIIHVVRDIRDVMASLNEQQWDSGLDMYLPRFWNNSNLYLHGLYKDAPSRYLLVRYEDLVQSPEQELRRISDLLAIPFQDTMTDHKLRHPRYRTMPAHSRLYKPISAEKVARYRHDVPETVIREYELQAREGLQAFGYPLLTAG